MRVNNIEIAEDLETILETLKTELSLKGIKYFNSIRPTGTENVMVSCPYHKDGQERKPSAGIKRSTGVFHCFSCGETHPFTEVVSHCFGYNDFGAYGWNWLLRNFLFLETEDGERRSIDLDFKRGDKDNMANSNSYVTEEELDKYRYYHPYWKKRGIVDENIIELFDLGYDKKTNSITFPVRDVNGNCLFVARRNVNTKFFNYPEGVEKPLYGLYELELTNPDWNEKYPDIFICESMIDCILLWQKGYYAVALNGLGNNLQFKQLKELSSRHLILATDNDEAGDRARDRIKKNVSNKIFSEIIFPNDIKDIGECTDDELAHILDWWEVYI